MECCEGIGKKMCIRDRTYLGKKRKESSEISLEAMQEEGIDFAEEKEENSSLHEEIIQYREELLLFGFCLLYTSRCV